MKRWSGGCTCGAPTLCAECMAFWKRGYWEDAPSDTSATPHKGLGAKRIWRDSDGTFRKLVYSRLPMRKYGWREER